jgi:glycosyltransferase involved in cell wall biosynthesis
LVGITDFFRAHFLTYAGRAKFKMANKKARTVFYFTPYAPDESDASGIRSRYHLEALKKDFDVYLLSSAFSKVHHRTVLRVPKNTYGSAKRLAVEILLGLELSTRVVFSSKDIYIFSLPPYFCILMMALTARIFRKKYVIDVRDIYPDVFFELGLVNKKSPLGKTLVALSKYAYQGADEVLSATNGVGEMLRDYRKETINTIFNGFDKDLIKPSKQKKQTFTAIFHGNLGKLQNIALLVDVANHFKDDDSIEFIVVGDGPQRDLVESCEKIDFLGKMDYEALLELIPTCHVGLSFRHDGPLNKTSFPVKTFEYIGARIPVVITPRCEAGQYVEMKSLGVQLENSEFNNIVESLKSVKIGSGINVDEFSRQNQASRFSTIIKKL